MQHRMRIYRLVPIAQPAHRRGKTTLLHGEVIVRARTSSDARLVASQAYFDCADGEAGFRQPYLRNMSSALESDELYAVVEDGSGQFVPNGPREVIGGQVRSEPIFSRQL